MSTEECIHGLDPQWCTLCLKKDMPVVHKTFLGTAMYEGTCPVCKDTIEIGERIASNENFLSGAWVHDECIDD
jgi:hypothetical protein